MKRGTESGRVENVVGMRVHPSFLCQRRLQRPWEGAWPEEEESGRDVGMGGEPSLMKRDGACR